jgi:transposase
MASAQGFKPPDISDLTAYSVDQVRTIIKAFNEDGFDSLNPKYCGGRPLKFSEEQRAQLVALATSRPKDLDLPFQQWSLSRLKKEAIRMGIVEDISQEWLRVILHEATITRQSIKTWKESKDPEFEKKKRRIDRLLAIKRNPPIVLALDEMGPLSLTPKGGKCWAPEKKPHRVPATYNKKQGVRYFFGVFNTKKKRIWGQLRKHKKEKDWFSFLKAIRRRYPKGDRIYVIQDNYTPHWTPTIRKWARKNRMCLVPTPTNASWLNPIECEFGPLQDLVFPGSNYESWGEVEEIFKIATKYRNQNRERMVRKRRKRKVRKPLWLRH